MAKDEANKGVGPADKGRQDFFAKRNEDAEQQKKTLEKNEQDARRRTPTRGYRGGGNQEPSDPAQLYKYELLTDGALFDKEAEDGEDGAKRTARRKHRIGDVVELTERHARHHQSRGVGLRRIHEGKKKEDVA